MPPLPSPPLLDATLRAVARRYRLPASAAAISGQQAAGAATALALAIEEARAAMARGETPGAALKDRFIDALARLIREALRTDAGDPVFQAMIMRHRAAHVREYASLSAGADQDRRQVRMAVNAIAHPGRQQRLVPGPQREALARLHASTSASSWSALHDTGRGLLGMPEIANEAPGLARLLDSPALKRLQRLEALEADDLVRQYRTLWDRQGPRPGSATASAQGVAARRRGAATEAQAAQALEALAQRLNQAEGAPASYRVVTSMRVPASIPATHDRAKTEWDAVLLRQLPPADAVPAWEICLLAEAKASVDAATTDLPKLLRGLRLLAHADPDVVYAFETQQGTVRLHGASLSALHTEEAGLPGLVLYCCDAPAEASPRLLGAASRMQLLSAQASLEFAGKLEEGQAAEAPALAPVWHELLESPRWRGVLNQYPTLWQVRELMVHPGDLMAAIDRAGA
ncbi:3-deoxy-D-arabino-heptulosonate 7-phosphate synthase [Cupriavidus consociatus]|uniref:3-deoxy-D-arabino-heptulosonate 7-phosphate synthase n=1 Tax=Cupriavidus consociatus TaxID=2821357 RepID=UPI001AE394C9|nr:MULTISPECIES: 3-deoxy-D-arabino-heptulosonate 7-phosphate synthase [unclassified Cupriavidus]MBP0620701.1 3-deoxy-D-arabino-heptulosonate 7-phosphate synthase [Cupriavidus sp. LEh25]MDK2657361.1 3-deoxy-D-arabino-heptulosonate 7-phosphate synthase [Cupriavidus sp. LEh21]